MNDISIWELGLNFKAHPLIFSAMRYIVRYERKGNAVTNLEKAINILSKLKNLDNYSILDVQHINVGLMVEFRGQFKGIKGLIIALLTRFNFNDYSDIEVIIELIEDLKEEYLKGVGGG